MNGFCSPREDLKRASFRLDAESNFLSIALEKPLGLILEEIEEGAPNGVKVRDLVETGSAYKSEYKEKLVGLKIASVQGQNVAACTFEDVMEKISGCPSPVSIEFEVSTENANDEGSIGASQLPVGTDVTLKVLQNGKPDLSISAKVGDNLRSALLANNVELYVGLKKKLGNCGGGGQCTFCAIEMMEDEGWSPRSDWEQQKIGKRLSSKARLACMNVIQGPAVIKTL